MSKKPPRSAASSGRAASGAFSSPSGFGTHHPNFGAASSSLSYIAEPPDFSSISDPQIVVSFKNLLKKDSVTKAKALEEIKDYLSRIEASDGGIEDGLLEAWVDLYPRTSIDASRRVRQLAHSLQGSLGLLCGKRIAKYLSRVVGAWVAGQYDNDRLVARIAQDSLTQVFPTEEKRRMLWRAYQSALLGYVDDAALQQTAQTLSDERTMSPDDSMAKHVRVVASAILVLRNVMSESIDKEASNDRALVEAILHNRKLWDYASHSDPFLRRAVYGLLQICLQNESYTLDWEIVSAAVISKAMHTSQLGSSLDFSETLAILTELHPDVWTDRYSSKAPAAKRLRQFLKKGSQGGPPRCWENISRVLRHVPARILLLEPAEANSTSKMNLQEAEGLTSCLFEGITRKDEPRPNLSAAWGAYVDISLWIVSQIDGQEGIRGFMSTRLSPLLSQYVRPSTSTSSWSINSPQASRICVECLSKIAIVQGAFFEALWTSLSDSLIEDMKLSLPAQSTGYRDSQDAISANANRLFSIQQAVLATGGPDIVRKTYSRTTKATLESAIQLLISRSGKPYGCAAVIDAAVRRVPELAFESPSGTSLIMDFLKTSGPTLVDSPSSDLLVSILLNSKGNRDYEDALTAMVDAFLASASFQRTPGFARILSLADLGALNCFPRIQEYIREQFSKALGQPRPGLETEWNQFGAFLGNPSISFVMAEDMIDSIVEEVLSGENVEETLVGLEVVIRESRPKIKEYVATSKGPTLLSRLILLCESPSEAIAQRATALRASIKSLLAEEGGASLTAKSAIEIIMHNLEVVDDNSLSVEIMLEQAKATLSDAAAEDKSVLAQLLFPARNLWEDKLRPFLDVTPNTAMAVTNALGGAINSVVGSSEAASEIYKISFDSDSFSPALRVVLFALRLIADLDVLSLVSADQRESTFIYFPMAIQLIDDNLTIAGANHMWNMYGDEIENEMADVVSEGRQVMARWIRESSHTPSADSAWVGKEFLAVWEAQLDNIQGCAPSMFHLGRSYARILSESADSAGTCIYASSWKDWIWKIRAVPDTIYGAAFSSAFKALLMSVGEGRRLINELMADLTGLDLDTSRDEAFRKLVLFNILSEGEESLLEDVPKQRLVFLVKHLVEWLQGRDAHVSLAIQAESLKSLTHVLPFISDVYGSHWQDILIVLEATVNDPASDQSLQWTYACLKMIATLKSLSKDDSNDDLTDSWEAWSETGLPRTLVNMLHSFHQDKYRVNQPRSIVTDALARQIGLTGVKSDEESVHSTYGLLREESSGVQKAAFTVISRYLPAAQENLSVRVGASGEAARLPDELLSLLLETPNTDALLRAHSEQRMWLNIRGYLLGWKVLFDHFETASHKVKNDYVDSIKEGDYLPSLLAFTFDFLGHATGKSIDASKFPIVSYALDAQETSEKDIQSLVIHLYFLCLVHVPIITKTWWIDSQKRVKGPIETWTQKFISSHVIASAFKTVSTWELESLADSDQSKLEIKISPKASELTASIAVGEGGDSPPISIAISLPPAYPLQPATVVGRQRVVVDEKKWRSWLLTIQGVIMFHGNLADGLIAFRKNVQGALKGQSECAICYSVISSDMQTPNKRCGTCKNMFHSSCLFRWFRSSNSSSCPLCRNSFNYG